MDAILQMRNGGVITAGPGEVYAAEDCCCPEDGDTGTGTGTGSGTFPDGEAGCVVCCEALPVRWRVRFPIAPAANWISPPCNPPTGPFHGSGEAGIKLILEVCRIGGTDLNPINRIKAFLWNEEYTFGTCPGDFSLNCGFNHGYTITEPASAFIEGELRYIGVYDNVCFWEGCLFGEEAAITYHGKLVEYTLGDGLPPGPPFFLNDCPYDVSCSDCDMTFTCRFEFQAILQMVSADPSSGTGTSGPCIGVALGVNLNSINTVECLDLPCTGSTAVRCTGATLGCATVTYYAECLGGLVFPSSFVLGVVDPCTGLDQTTGACGGVGGFSGFETDGMDLFYSDQCLGPLEIDYTTSASTYCGGTINPFITGPIEVSAA